MGLSSVASPAWWAGFGALVLVLLALDLGVFHRKERAVAPREALAWSGFWISLALLFGAGVFFQLGAERGEEFLAGYLVEKSLSVDNLFVFVVLFGALRIPAHLQHRVLFWGILSALVLRGVMIFAGAALLARFHWLMYVFGALLLLTGVKLWWQRGEEAGADAGPVLRWVRRLVPSTAELRGSAIADEEGLGGAPPTTGPTPPTRRSMKPRTCHNQSAAHVAGRTGQQNTRLFFHLEVPTDLSGLPWISCSARSGACTSQRDLPIQVLQGPRLSRILDTVTSGWATALGQDRDP